MRLLCLGQHFRQGWGGLPESARLLARELAPLGISVDVFDRGRLHRRIELLDLLPEPDFIADTFDPATLPDYRALLIFGPWQDPRAIWPLLRARRDSQTLVYLPRGGMCRIEFSRPRDLKKWPYLYLIERGIIRSGSAIVYSSECERDHTVRPVRGLASEWIIPDFFSPLPPPEFTPSGGAERPVRFSFMAEISPRKGLVPVLEAFLDFSRSLPSVRAVQLTIGGGVRPGSEAYLAKAKSLAAQAPPHARIEFVGAVPHAERSRFYAETDVFLASSLFESYGLTVLEALAAGCAVVTGPTIGSLEYLPPMDLLDVSTSDQPADLAAALARQNALAMADHASRRARASNHAQSAIAALNCLATERWSQLLGF